MLVRKTMVASLWNSQFGGAWVINCMGIQPRFCLRQKIKHNGDTNWSEDTRNSAAYAFYSSLPVQIAGQINFEVKVTVADCEELGILRV
jgi:hypothetical protein